MGPGDKNRRTDRDRERTQRLYILGVTRHRLGDQQMARNWHLALSELFENVYSEARNFILFSFEHFVCSVKFVNTVFNFFSPHFHYICWSDIAKCMESFKMTESSLSWK